MISKDTAMDIALAYREIEAAEKLRDDVDQALDRISGKDIRDVFGRRVEGLQLGVPSGDNGHRLFNLPHSVAKPILEAHIAQQRARIAAGSERAIGEMATGGMRLGAGWDASVERSTLRHMLEECGKQFRFYEESHRAKGTEESLAKADINAGFAARIEELLG